MFKYILIVLFFVCPIAFVQVSHNFKIENSQLEWQKVYQSKLSKVEIEKILKEKGIFKNLNYGETEISGEIENITADYQGAGKNNWNTSFYVQNSSIRGNFHIELKDGRYRVTLNAINLKTINELSDGGISVMSANSVQPLSDFAIRKGEFRKGFLKADAHIFEHTFNNLFDFNNHNSKSDDW